MAVRGLAAGAPRALLIDALGTLVALEPPGPLVRELVAGRFGVEISAAQADAAIAAEIAYYRSHMAQGRDPASVAQLRDRSAEVLREALPAPARDAVPTGRPCTALLLDAIRFRVFEDARELLLATHASGIPVIVASNWDASLPDVLAQVGLLDLLEGVVTSAVAGAPKPAEEVFRAALALAGAAPHETLHVGDDPDADVVGATAVGITAVLLARGGGTAPEGVPTITSLSQLPGIAGWSLLSG